MDWRSSTVVSRTLSTATAVAVGLTCCDGNVSSGDPAPAATSAAGVRADAARSTCESALPQAKIYSATLSTVQAVREHGVGPGDQPARDAFAGSPPGDPAAWCWVVSGEFFDVYGVSASEAVLFGRIERSVVKGEAAGPPRIV